MVPWNRKFFNTEIKSVKSRVSEPVPLCGQVENPRFSGPPHPFLPFTRRLVGVLGPVVQVPGLPVSNARHHNSFRRGVAAQLIGHDYSRTTVVNPQQPAKETHRREPVALFLHENIDHNTVLIRRGSR